MSAKQKPTTTTVSLDLPTTVFRRLEGIAGKSDTTVEALIADAVGGLLQVDDEYLRELDQAIAEADRGEFATDEEAAHFFARFGTT